MTIIACRDECRKNKTSLASHAGVLLSTQLRETGDEGAEKLNLLKFCIGSLKRANEVYKPAFERWKASTSGPAFLSRSACVSQRLVVGLGSESALETGLTLHYTYGVPIVPGSALKGLTASYFSRVLGQTDKEFRVVDEFATADGKKRKRAGKYYEMLFGTNEGSGILTFHDAWILPESIDNDEALTLDVMTPHHGGYYSRKEGVAPHDSEDPNPIRFLSTRGKFRPVLEVEGACADAMRWCEYTMKILLVALGDWGVGGKTTSGYGRMKPDEVA